MVKAYCLLSGGLDSILAAKLLSNQGIEVVGVHFVSPFFDKSESVKKTADELSIQLKILNISQEHLDLVQNPHFGFGKNFNPCIDCHSFMFHKAAQLIDLSKKEFLASGEVLGQRPMSQNKNSLLMVAKHSKLKERILRPLSAKLLPQTMMETEGWVDREKLLDIGGRGRKRQFALAEEWGIKSFPKPGGGCLLTDPTFSKRLKALDEDNMLGNLKLVDTLKYGRLLKIADAKYLIVSRNQEESEYLASVDCDLKSSDSSVAGPVICGYGEFSEQDYEYAAKVFNFYCKEKGDSEASLKINGKKLNVSKLLAQEKEAIKEALI